MDSYEEEYVMQSIAVRPAEAARISGLSRSMIYVAISEKSLRSVKVRSARLIFIDDLREWLNRQAVEQGV